MHAALPRHLLVIIAVMVGSLIGCSTSPPADDPDAILALGNFFAAAPAKAGFPSVTVPGGFVVPVTTPPHWRAYNRERTLSERFLAVVQRIDAPTNSFPSMHVSVAMLTALHLVPHVGAAALAFPLVIALSCLFTKQHYVMDLPAGALLGLGSFAAYQILL